MRGYILSVVALALVGTVFANPSISEKLRTRSNRDIRYFARRGTDKTCYMFGQSWAPGKVPSTNPCDDCECYSGGQGFCFNSLCMIPRCGENEQLYKGDFECCERCVSINEINGRNVRNVFEKLSKMKRGN